MEIVRKKICLDEFLSHRQGLVPYIKKNDEDQGIQYINTITSNSNYGGFPCDFALMSRNKKIDENTGLSIFDDKELSRFRYVDIINEYSRYLDKINNGIILKKIIYNKEIVEYLDCITSSNTITHVISAVRWVVYNGDISFFDCLPVDASFFTSSDNETYYFNESINDLKQILLEKQTGDRTFGLRATPEPIPQPGIDDIEPEPEDEPEIESGITADEEKILNKTLEQDKVVDYCNNNRAKYNLRKQRMNLSFKDIKDLIDFNEYFFDKDIKAFKLIKNDNELNIIYNDNDVIKAVIHIYVANSQFENFTPVSTYFQHEDIQNKKRKV